jgi:hypothetical protein
VQAVATRQDVTKARQFVSKIQLSALAQQQKPKRNLENPCVDRFLLVIAAAPFRTPNASFFV